MSYLKFKIGIIIIFLLSHHAAPAKKMDVLNLNYDLGSRVLGFTLCTRVCPIAKSVLFRNIFLGIIKKSFGFFQSLIRGAPLPEAPANIHHHHR